MVYGNIGIKECFEFKFVEDRIENEGEDAEPTLMCVDERGMIAVYDGLGGAGSARFGAHTGAYAASRVVKCVAEEHFNETDKWVLWPKDGQPISKYIADELKIRINCKFSELLNDSETSDRKIKSKLIHRLPSTVAAAYFHKIEPRIENKIVYACHVIWAGDSRVYILNELSGLQQITKDDVKIEGDALATLIEDPPLSNFISSDANYNLHYYTITLNLPVVLIVSTDGCFSYLQSPSHFEYLLLSTLSKSASPIQWRANVIAELKGVAADDCSMALIAIGWERFEEIKSSFIQRLEHVDEKFVKPIDNLNIELSEMKTRKQNVEREIQHIEHKINENRHNLWKEYKRTYEASEIAVLVEQ